MPLAEYARHDGLGLATLVARGEVTPRELADEALARIERHNATLNAVVRRLDEPGRACAAAPGAGPFRGVPFLLKDILGNLAGVPTQAGSRFLAGLLATEDDTLVVRFKAAGVVPLGKTNVPEFGLLPTTEPLLYGPVRNPWNLAHSAGGSSGGAAAAVAAGIVPLAHANDGGGSIRIPASCCGLVGLKPSRARNPLGPTVGDVLSGFVVEHVVSRTVRDTAAMLDCTAGPEPGDPYMVTPPVRPFLEEARTPPGRLRIAIATRLPAGKPSHPECVAAVEATARLCETLGHIVEEAAPPLDPAQLVESFLPIWAAGLAMQIEATALRARREIRPEAFEPLTWALYERGRQVSAARYLMALASLQQIGRAVGRFHERYDCWLTPTLAAPPLVLGTIDVRQRDVDAAFPPIVDYVPFTPWQNVTGQPAISLPLHWSADGLPVGVMFSARLGDEATLLRLAGQLEEARPWSDRYPPIWG